jgi:hypothetical protein
MGNEMCWLNEKTYSKPIKFLCKNYKFSLKIFSSCMRILDAWILDDGEFTVFVGFEVFTAVVMKSIIIWDMMPCGP